MGKNKTYIIMISFIAILFFSIAALCNIGNSPSKESDMLQEGTAESISSTEKEEGKESVTEITINKTTETLSAKNNPPTILSLKVSEGTIFCDSIVDADVEAKDLDGDTLSYKWLISTNATINDINSPNTEWKAPASSGGVKIVVTVSDGRGGITERAIEVPIVAYSSGEKEKEEVTVKREAPTITLQIYEGPTYSPADNVCYYRIEAIVTGNPAPDVEFSKDDSLGTWGSNKCQININNPSETYTLNATATNSEGAASASIDLSWGCEETYTSDEETAAGKGGGDDELSIKIQRLITGGFIGLTTYYDFTLNAPSALWRHDCWHVNPPPGVGVTTFGDTYTYDRYRYGAAFYGDNATLEDANTYPRVLETQPYMANQGFICGIYQNITIPENATFTTRFGFLQGHVPTHEIHFEVFFDDYNDTYLDYCHWHKLVGFKKSYDGNLNYMTRDLNLFAGQTGDFIFLVRWGESYESISAVWLYPVIVTMP